MNASHSGDVYNVYEPSYHKNQRCRSQSQNNNGIGVEASLKRNMFNPIIVITRGRLRKIAMS